MTTRKFSEGAAGFTVTNSEFGTEFGVGLTIDGAESVSMGLAFLRQTVETGGMNLVSVACRALQSEGVALVGVDLSSNSRDVLHAILAANFGGGLHKVSIDDGLVVEFYGVGTGQDIIELAETYAANVTAYVLPAYVREAVSRGYADQIFDDMKKALADFQEALAADPGIQELLSPAVQQKIAEAEASISKGK